MWALWCALSYLISSLILPGNTFLYILVIKVPIIVGDTGVAYLLLHVARKKFGRNPSFQLKLAGSFLFNPYVLAVGVVWSMMDSIIGLLIVLCAMCLTSKRPAWTGAFLALGTALKLYPIILLPACLIYSIKGRQDKIRRPIIFLATFSCCALIMIVAPFLIFNWSTTGFVGLIFAQASRSPNGGIAPLSVFNYLLWNGILTLGPISIVSVYSSTPLRYVWVLAFVYAAWYLDAKRQAKSLSELLQEFILMYVVYCLTAPWVSEQMIEPLLIMMLFVTAAISPERIGLPYVLGSATAFLFVALHVPLTAFISPISNFDSTSIVNLVKPVIPWLVVVFGLYLVYEMALSVKQVEFQFSHD